MRKQQKDQIKRLFGALMAGKFDEFFAGCADDLTIEFRGSTPTPTRLTKSRHPRLVRLPPGALADLVAFLGGDRRRRGRQRHRDPFALRSAATASTTASR